VAGKNAKNEAVISPKFPDLHPGFELALALRAEDFDL
jgi:hypothetical protein